MKHNGTLYVKQRGGHLSYVEDPKGYRSMLAKSLTVDHSTQGCIKVRFYSEGMKGVGACFKRYTIYILYFPLSGPLLHCKKKFNEEWGNCPTCRKVKFKTTEIIAFPGHNYRCIKTNLSMRHYKTYSLTVYCETRKFSDNLILALFVTKMKRTWTKLINFQISYIDIAKIYV